MHGVFITSDIMDWQVIQQEQGYGMLQVSGYYQVPAAAIKVGTDSTYPMIRILNEEDNSQVISWTRANFIPEEDGMCGSWDISLSVPAGGLYRIETGLDTKSTKPNLGWIFRGDVRLHIGIGDLFLIAGQSNSSGYGKDPAFDPPDINVHLYRNRGTWDLACHPLNESSFAADSLNAEMGVSGTSPYLSFARAFHKLSHYPVGLIITALGGSPISRWDVTQNGDLYHNMIHKIKACGGKAAGILWYQGCSDTTPDLSLNYYESFERVVQETRKELAYEIPFFTFQLNRQINAEYKEGWGIVREAQRQASHRIPKVFILPTLHCSLCDGIHNNSHSSVLLGESLAKLCGNVLYQGHEYLAPDISDAILEAETIRISFHHVRRGFIIIDHNPQSSGFQIKDINGIVPFLTFTTDKEHPNVLEFTLARTPVAPVTVSYGWDSDPTPISLFDEVSYLPILSFYEFPVKEKYFKNI